MDHRVELVVRVGLPGQGDGLVEAPTRTLGNRILDSNTYQCSHRINASGLPSSVSAGQLLSFETSDDLRIKARLAACRRRGHLETRRGLRSEHSIGAVLARVGREVTLALSFLGSDASRLSSVLSLNAVVLGMGDYPLLIIWYVLGRPPGPGYTVDV